VTVLVLDASAVVDLLLRNRTGALVRERLGDADLHTVAHLDAEVFSALARLHRAGTLRAGDVETRLRLLASLDMLRLPITGALLREAWTLRENVTARDALYVALARRLKGRLLTTDHRLARAVPTLAVGLEPPA
jgi:predicted nucleic acid-binding protein